MTADHNHILQLKLLINLSTKSSSKQKEVDVSNNSYNFVHIGCAGVAKLKKIGRFPLLLITQSYGVNCSILNPT